jgi:arylsulfatase
VRPWTELSEREQAFAIKLQEAFAAFLDHTDAQLGRLLDALADLRLDDNTLVIATSDNGASQEGNETGVLDEFRHFNGLPEDMESASNRLEDIGTRRSFTNYPWGWAQVGNTPAKRYKQNTHGGGVRDPLIISWPKGIDPACNGQIRQQFHHITDIMPTIMEICGYDLPHAVKGVPQQPIEGISMRYTFASEAANAEALPTRKPAQYFEMFGHRGIWSEGWKAVTYHRARNNLDEDVWELYHLDEDFSECHNLAESHPEKLTEMIELFWSEAEKYGVLPIETNQNTGLFAGRPQPGTPRAREHFVYFPPLDRIPTDSTPPFGARSWDLEARLQCKNEPEGALLAVGTVNNGLCIYFKEGHLVYDHNAFTEHTVIRSTKPVPTGDVMISVSQQRVSRGPARVMLKINDEVVGEGMVPNVPVMISSIGMDIGSNPTGVSEAFNAPFPFNGKIQRIDIETTRALRPDDELAIELEQALRTQ